MSIINSFDNKSKPIIDVNSFYEKKGDFSDTCIVSFSCHVLDMFLNKYKSEIVAQVGTGNGHIDIYLFEVENKKILFYMSPIGSCVAGTIMYEVAYITGAKKFIVYGSCGILDNEACKGKLIVPTASYRDEGLSYHYAPCSDYIEIKQSSKVASILDKYGLPYVLGKSWTTDAFYMETVNKANARRKEGCIVVEMESSGLEAVCDYYGYELYTFFFGADLLENEVYNSGVLAGTKEHDIQKATFDIALKIALNI